MYKDRCINENSIFVITSFIRNKAIWKYHTLKVNVDKLIQITHRQFYNV